MPQTLRWMRLDNAAKIYPAARRSNWTSLFRLSADLDEPVDVPTLQSSLDVTVRRFPSIATRLRKGVFWYYLEELSQAPVIGHEHSYPLVRMTREELRRCAFRVIVYGSRIAVELFHSLTDGTGGMVFLKSLLAEYVQQRYGTAVPCEQGVLDRRQSPRTEELEDSFLKHAGPVSASRREHFSWQVRGELEQSEFCHLTCFRLSASRTAQCARAHGVSMTVFLAAAMLMAMQNLQAVDVPDQRKRKYIRILVPVNLRQLFPSKTLRNFALYSTPEIDPRLGEYSFDEICRIVSHRMGMDVQAKRMSTRIATNVESEKSFFVKILPLFIKNVVMKAIFNAVGERTSALSLSNLGQVAVPAELADHITRMDFVLGVPATTSYNCGVLSWKDDLYINISRNLVQPRLEAEFHRVLQSLGLTACVENNQRR